MIANARVMKEKTLQQGGGMRGDCNKNVLENQMGDFMASRRGLNPDQRNSKVNKDASREISQSRLGSFVKGLFG